MYILGIDPGVTGAVAILKDGILSTIIDMPTMSLGAKGTKRQVNAAELAKEIKKACAAIGDQNLVYLERVSSMPRQGVASTFNFGVSYGVVLGVLAALGLPVILVSPAVWKRTAGLLGNSKDAARTLAQLLYPYAPLGMKKHIGRADAILIARYGGGK